MVRIKMGGMYYDDISPKRQPSFGTQNRPWSTDALPFVTMAYTAFDMHFNSPRFYAELQNASIPRFRQVVTVLVWNDCRHLLVYCRRGICHVWRTLRILYSQQLLSQGSIGNRVSFGNWHLCARDVPTEFHGCS